MYAHVQNYLFLIVSGGICNVFGENLAICVCANGFGGKSCEIPPT